MSSNAHSSAPTPAGGMLRTGLKAGAAFAGGMALGVVLALLLGAGVFFYYLSRLQGAPGMPAARAGGAGAWVALLFSPPTLIACLLLLVVPAYVFVGVQLGRARAVARVVQQHGAGLAQRLAEPLAARIEAMPRTHQALHRGSDALSMREVMGRIEPWLGGGRVVRATVRFVLARLPLADIQQQWLEARAEHGGVAQPQDGALRSLLGHHIDGVLQDLATPSYRLLWLLMAGQAALLAVGIWLTA